MDWFWHRHDITGLACIGYLCYDYHRLCLLWVLMVDEAMVYLALVRHDSALICDIYILMYR